MVSFCLEIVLERVTVFSKIEKEEEGYGRKEKFSLGHVSMKKLSDVKFF